MFHGASLPMTSGDPQKVNIVTPKFLRQPILTTVQGEHLVQVDHRIL